MFRSFMAGNIGPHVFTQEMFESRQFIEIDHQNTTICVVLLNYDYPAYLCGTNIVNVKAIRGTVRIWGYDLLPRMPPVRAYTFKGFNPLRVMPVKDWSTEEDTPYLESLHLPADVTEKALYYSHFFVVTKSEESDSFVSFLRNTTDLPRFVQTDTNDSRMVTLFPTAKERLSFEYSDWYHFAKETRRRIGKILVCGENDVGKSTFIRYLINRHLGRWERVLAIDFDPVQCEFTVIGCLSAVLVEQPLLGPNFPHPIAPEKIVYLGNIDVSSCREWYSHCVERLVNFCNSAKYRDIPWIINTIDLVGTDSGVSLLARIIKAIKPTDIVQIKSRKMYSIFPSILLPSFLNLLTPKPNGGTCWSPRLRVVPSLSASSSSSSRDLMTMSYLRRATKREETNLLNVIPKKIKMDDVEIVVVRLKRRKRTMTKLEKLAFIKHKLVALCTGNSLDQLDCLGFGVVRGFNLQIGFIYLITPESEEALNRVTVIWNSPYVQISQKLFKE